MCGEVAATNSVETICFVNIISTLLFAIGNAHTNNQSKTDENDCVKTGDILTCSGCNNAMVPFEMMERSCLVVHAFGKSSAQCRVAGKAKPGRTNETLPEAPRSASFSPECILLLIGFSGTVKVEVEAGRQEAKRESKTEDLEVMKWLPVREQGGDD